tara:strand:- start:726 stop:3608 length:2883 start_codon:yes stop_codon:yes gene_type:complete
MAIGYQKAYKVRNGSLEDKESHYTSLGKEACQDVGGTWFGGECHLGVESPTAEKYNKLAKAFNDRLTSGAGDPTWRVFFYVHSLTRGMIIPPLDAPQPGVGIKEENTSYMQGANKNDHNEDVWWKLHSHIELHGWDSKEAFKTFGQYVWPTRAFAKPGGANPANPLVSYVMGTGKNGANVTNNWHDMRKMPPEWFRLGMIPISFFPVKPTWAAYVSDYPLWYYDSQFNTNNDTNENNFTSGRFSTRHRPITMTEKWVMAKLQRGAAAFVSVNGSAVTGKLRAEAPAYFAPRIYHKFDYNWRSPHGKYAPSYAPSADIIGYCPPSDPRFPPSPIHEYKFKPINPDTHSELSFTQSCGYHPFSINKVRRKYDFYELEFVGGFHLEINDKGGGSVSYGKPVKGPLKLPYKYYLEGSYEGGGNLEKREAYHDQIDQISNYFNSGFRKTPEMAQQDRDILGDSLYNSVGEATFDLPTYNFEFEDFFQKQYSLAPAFGGSQSISTKDGKIPRITPRYPRFIARNTGAEENISASLSGGKYFRLWEKDKEGYGTYKNLNKLYFTPTSGFCVAGYYAWGTGIRIKHTRAAGATTTVGDSLTFKINKKNKWGSAVVSSVSVTVDVTAVSTTGLCYNGSNPDSANNNSIADCLTADGKTFIQEGIFQKMYYFAAGEEISNSRVELELVTSGVKFLAPNSYTSNNLAGSDRSEIVFELAHLLEYKPDLPDALALLRVASTGKGSKIEQVDGEEDIWFGPLVDSETMDSGQKSRATSIDTRGKDMDYLASKGTDSDSAERKNLREPFDIWQEYNSFGYIPNIMGALELPDKMAKGYNKDTDYTYANLMANFAAGGDPFQNNYVPINLNPIYDSARELYGDNLRMIPRTQFVDYRVEENCPYCSNEYYTTEKACIEAGYDWGGVYKRDKSVLTFNRYINGVAEAGEPELGGLGSESIGTIVYDPNVEQPKEEG